MVKQVIRRSDAPASALFSQAIKVGAIVFVSIKMIAVLGAGGGSL